MVNEKFKIRKNGNRLVAINEQNVSMGSINIKTRKFIGATLCWQQLEEALNTYKVKTGNKNKPKFFQAVLQPIENIVEHCYPMSKEGQITIKERMGDENATCPECGENQWWFLPNESVAVSQGGKPYMECLICGYTTHF